MARRWSADGTKRSDDAQMARRWSADGTKRSDDAQMARRWSADGTKRSDDAQMARRWSADGTKRSDDAQMARRWSADGTKRSDDAQMARRWSIYIFENVCIGSYAPKLFTKFFSLSFLRKEFLFKIFFMIPFISFYPQKNVRVRGHFDDVAYIRGNGLDLSYSHYLYNLSLVCTLYPQ